MPPARAPWSSGLVTVTAEIPIDLKVPLDEIRRRHVVRVLDACGGNRSEAAKILGVDRKTLYRRLRRWGVEQ